MNLEQLKELERKKAVKAEIDAKQQTFPEKVSDAGLIKALTPEERKAAFEKLREAAE